MRDRGQSIAVGLVVAGGLLLSLVVHYALALQQKAPWLMGDELRYAEMAKSFLDEGRLLFREEFTSFATAYPALIAPAWAAADIETAYELSKAINVVLMTCCVVVVFLWTRRLAPPVYALAAAGLVLLMPTFAYTGMLMMENAALPAFLLAAFVAALALERPTLARQLLVFAAIGLAAALRVQLVTLAIVYPSAILLGAVFARRAGVEGIKASLARFRPSAAVLVLGGLAYVTYKLAVGSSLSSGLAAYSMVAELDYDPAQVLRWSLWHAGELVLSVGFLPAAAFGALLAAALARGGVAEAPVRAFVAVATATTFWFVLQAATYASRLTGRIEERYMVYAAPLLLTALIVWLVRARPRSPLPAAVAALVPAVLALTIPFERVFNVPILANTFGLIPFLRLSRLLDGGTDDLRLVLAGGLAVATIAWLTLSSRLARVLLPAAVGLFLALSAYTVYGAVEVQADGARGAVGASEPTWVDRSLGRSGEAGLIVSAGLTANPHLLWQTEFWNRSVRGVYALDIEPVLTFAGPEVTIDTNGHLVSKAAAPRRSLEEPYVLADPSLGIVGDTVVKPGPLALIRVDPPIRIASRVEGVYADGWSSGLASISQFAPLPGGQRLIRLRVSRAGWRGPDVPGTVTIAAGPLDVTAGGPVIARVTATRRSRIRSGQSRTLEIRVPPAPFRLEVRVTPTFSPAQFGQPDTRQLGVQLTLLRAG